MYCVTVRCTYVEYATEHTNTTNQRSGQPSSGCKSSIALLHASRVMHKYICCSPSIDSCPTPRYDPLSSSRSQLGSTAFTVDFRKVLNSRRTSGSSGRYRNPSVIRRGSFSKISSPASISTAAASTTKHPCPSSTSESSRAHGRRLRPPALPRLQPTRV
jgi:hypothetical protein